MIRTEKVDGGTEMKHVNAVGWSDFVNHAAVGGRQKATQKHRGAHRKDYAQTAALWRKIADAAVVEAHYQPAAGKVCFVQAAFPLSSALGRRRGTHGVGHG